MTIQCELCPKYCILSHGERGDCKIRININDKLLALTHSFPCAIHIDPIEKKPLYHFLPGKKILSLATAGCNLHCKNCQNYEISQAKPEEINAYALAPKHISFIAKKFNTNLVAYTYTEPLAYYEYTLDLCMNAKKSSLKNVLVSAGYINKPPLLKLLPYIDAANIDLKSMSDNFYKNICKGTLKPVLNTLTTFKEFNIILEITNLIIPTLNDSKSDIKKLVKWVAKNLGDYTPIHFSRFFPRYKLKHLPPTPLKTMEVAYNTAKDEGLKHVYLGNLSKNFGENTICPSCNKTVVKREGYNIKSYYIENNKCKFCKKEIYGLWK